MEIAEAIKRALQELIVPELESIKAGHVEFKAIMELTNKRLDDINLHLVDQSRRIDEVNRRIDETNARIEQRMDEVNERIERRIGEVNARIEQVNARIEQRMDEVNRRLDHLYEVIVRRDEFEKLEFKILKLESEVAALKTKISA